VCTIRFRWPATPSRKPLAVATSGGLTASSLLTLVFVPVSYTVLADSRERIMDETLEAAERPLVPDRAEG